MHTWGPAETQALSMLTRVPVEYINSSFLRFRVWVARGYESDHSDLPRATSMRVNLAATVAVPRKVLPAERWLNLRPHH